MPTEARSTHPERCPSCGAGDVRRDRVVFPRPSPIIEALACSGCGDWWFETAGERLTTDALVRMGLAG